MATRDPSAVDATLVAQLRERCRRAGREASEAEARAALATVSLPDEKALRAVLLGPVPAKPLGPMAFVDLARGAPLEVAAARELSGYYALLAERDALATMAGVPQKPAPAVEKPAERPAPAAESRKQPDPKPRLQTRADELLGLYAYHRDGPLVARALGLSLAELEAELDAHKLRRKAARLVRGLDTDLPQAQPVLPGRSGPPLRRRKGEKPPPPPKQARPAPAPPPPPPLPAKPKSDEAALQAAALKKLLSEVGPRRHELAERLGSKAQPLPIKVLLARFRAAGLERELGQRERDLLRGLYSRHRGATKAVAAELKLGPEATLELVKERGLLREVESLREEKRREARARAWPAGRIQAILAERDWLEDLGILEELEGEVKTRTLIAWDKLLAAGKTGREAVEALGRELHLRPDEARRLARRLGLP